MSTPPSVGHAPTSTAPTASIARRAVAQVIDAAVALLVFGLIAGGATAALGGLLAGTRSPVAAVLAVGPAAMLAGALVAGALPIVLEWAWDGRTVGKRLVGVRVVDEHGGAAGLGAIVARNVLRAVDAVLFYLVGAVAMATSARRQRIGDRVAGTVVVRGRP